VGGFAHPPNNMVVMMIPHTKANPLCPITPPINPKLPEGQDIFKIYYFEKDYII
jgi:hypothetical protein